MYTLTQYCSFIADDIRTGAYVAALRAAVKPSAVVLDIGAGTGFFAVLACRLGARKAYAVETSEALQLGPELARANGVAGQVEFIQDLSTSLELPERADVIISDLRGRMPLLSYHIPSIADARERFLAPGGTLIPLRDTLFAALVTAPQHYEDNIVKLTCERYGMNLQAARRFFVHQMHNCRVEREQLLTAPQKWAALDYQNIVDPDVDARLQLHVERAGLAHGISLWFEAGLGPGIGYTTAPYEPALVYGNPYLPLAQPIEVAAGDTVALRLQAKLVNEDYIWRWETQATTPDGTLKADLRQSTLQSRIFSPGEMRKHAAEFVPALNEEGRIDSYILNLLDKNTPLGDIASCIQERFPRSCPSWQKAMIRVGQLAAKYSR